MERYLQQLAEDFRDAANNVPTTEEVRAASGVNIPEELEMFAYAELYLRLPPKKLSDILGIEKEVLPPPERLTKNQTIFLYNEITKLLHAYHFSTDLPQELPVNLKYSLIYKHWNDKHVFTGEGEVVIEFCAYRPSHCPYPKEFCWCKNMQDEHEKM